MTLRESEILAAIRDLEKIEMYGALMEDTFKKSNKTYEEIMVFKNGSIGGRA